MAIATRKTSKIRAAEPGCDWNIKLRVVIYAGAASLTAIRRLMIERRHELRCSSDGLPNPPMPNGRRRAGAKDAHIDERKALRVQAHTADVQPFRTRFALDHELAVSVGGVA